MGKYILAIDQGTTGSTALLITEKGKIKAKHNCEFRQIYPKPGWVEHNPDDIWKSVQTAIKSVLSKSKISVKDILSIGITNQRETVLGWDSRTGRPVYNAIVWQCRRTTDLCRKWKKIGREKSIKAKTGLVLDPYFSGTKALWILENVPRAKKLKSQGYLRFGTIDSYILWKLTGGVSHKTDVSNASRTLFLNLKTNEYDSDLLRLFNINHSMLPEVCSSSDDFGVTKGAKILPDGVPITGMIGDQQSALFGQGGFKSGDLKVTFGTGSFILFNTGNKIIHSKNGLLATAAWRLKGEAKTTYALEGGAFICGAAIQWLRDELGFFSESSKVESLANKVKDTAGVQVVPAFVGLGAPYWEPGARGIISGLTRGTNRNHIIRATLESMALQNVDIMNVMSKEAKYKVKKIKVDGGASANNLLMQMQADFSRTTVVRPKNIETTAMGAAFMAGHGIGLWKKSDLIKLNSIEKEFKTRMKPVDTRQRLVQWKLAIEAAKLMVL